MKKDNIKAIYPLSALQEGMLFHKLYDQDDTSYHIQNAFWVDGEIDESFVKKALYLLGEKHEVLKTAFVIPQSTGRPWQVILKDKEIELSLEKHAADELGYVETVKENDLHRGFDLQKDSLMRLHVVSFSEKKHYFLFSFSHIIMDGWCVSLLFGDFLRYYEGLNSGKTFEGLLKLVSDEKAGQGEYKDYIDWQKKQDNEGALAYWEHVLENYEGSVEIEPLEEPKVSLSKAMSEEIALTKEETARLHNFAIKQKVTVNTVVESMIGVFLQRYCFLDDVVYGKVVSGRNAPIRGIERIVGLFINTIPTRIQTQKDMTVAQLLEKVQRDGEESNRYDFCELSAIQAKTQQGADLINVIYAFENYFFDSENMKVGENGLSYAMESEREQTNYDLTFSAHITDGKLSVSLLYESGRYPQSEIQRMLVHLKGLLLQITDRPNKKVADLELVTDEEKVLICRDFNNTAVSYPSKETVVSLLENQVKQTPDNVAVVFEDTTLTYAQLNDSSNALAHKLRELGIGKEDFVAIISKRSAEVVIGVCAVLKAGGAYLPIDDAYPKKKKKSVLEDCNAKAVLNYKAAVPEDIDIPVISLDDTAIYEGNLENPDRVNDAEDLAYCIYTSGTTGKGKGVMITHKNIIKLVKGQDYTSLNTATVILQTGQLAFDASTFEIWGSILNGGQVHLISEDALLDIVRFKNYIIEQKINTLFMTTALFNQLISEDPAIFDTLEHFMFGGEKTSEKCVDILMERGKVSDVRNVYGPTETTTFATHYIIDKKRKKTPIGKPISNTQTYVLNGNSLCGIGVPGELCIAGEGVARGYLNQPDLTNEKFIANPYGEGKLYRSGDLVRFLSDGNIEFIGRIDELVKIRGFRIELGEISEAIRAMEGISETAVVVDSLQGEKVICAYIVGEGKIEIESIKNRLRKCLPAYMIPAYMMQIEQIPMNSNGKLDKRALPKIEITRSKEYKAPTSAEEEAVCQVYEEVLGSTDVGVLDSFYELGGDSIKAIRIVSKIRGKGYSLSVKDIMDSLDIEQTAKRLLSENRIGSQEEVTGVVSVTPIIERFFSWNLQNPDYFNQDILITLAAEDVPYVKEAFKALAKHHDMLRMVYQNRQLEILPISESPLCELKEVFLEKESNWEEEISQESTKLQAGMSLSNPPILKGIVFHVGEKAYLFVCIHHLAVDGVSWRILIEDLHNAIGQLKDGNEVSLPYKTDAYPKWAEALKAYGEKASFEKEKNYWAQVQSEVSAYGRLKERSEADGYGELEFSISEKDTLALLRDTQKAYHTETNDILLSALGTAIKKWTGQDKIAIGLEGHGRDLFDENLNIDRTVGWFTCIYPFIVSCQEDMGSCIIENKENLRKIPLHGIGYGLCQKEYINETPDICFNYLGQMDAEQNNGVMRFCSTGKSCMDGDGQFDGISINCIVIHKVLQVSIQYEYALINEAEAADLAGLFKECLENYIHFLCAKKETTKTPSDYLIPACTMENINRIKETYPDLTDIYPLTPLQEGMLYHNLSDPDSTAYIIQHVIGLDGAVNEQALKDAVFLTALKHEALRNAVFCEEIERPVQVVLGNRKPEFETADLSKDDLPEAQEKFEVLLKEDVARGFDLSVDSLVRVKLVKFSDTSHKMIWCYHHIVIDGWCLSLVYGSFIKYYDLLIQGESKASLAAKITENAAKDTKYRDYIAWLCQQDKEKGLSYFDELLAGYDGIAQIRPFGIPDSGTEQMQECEAVLSKEETDSLLSLAHNQNVTINILAEAAWGLALQIYTGTNDVVFGKIVSGRTAKVHGIENAVGFFINTVPVRVETKEEESISELLQVLKQNSIYSDQHSYCALSEIQSRTRQKTDLIKTVFVFENYELDEETLLKNASNIKISMETQREQTNYAMGLVMGIKNGAMHIAMKYDPRIYGNNEIMGILNRVGEILREMLEFPKGKVSDLAAISDSEKDIILKQFNNTGCPYPKNKTIIDLFTAEVQKHGNKTAVVFADQKITYQELNAKANKLAAVLRKDGVSRNQLVMLIANRSVEMIVGILGILKAGAAYLPVDVTLPQERLLYMLKDSQAAAIVSFQNSLTDTDVPVYALENLDSWEAVPEVEPINESHDLAYCIYTSGTTGLPKGVLIEHYGVANLRTYFVNTHGVSENDCMLQFANYAFDAFISEFAVGLLTGGTLYILDERAQKDFALFEEFLKKHQITMAILPPQYLNQISLKNTDVRTIITAGSATSSSIVEKNAFVPVYSNDYGPTEATVCATYWKHENTEPIPVNIPIGKPMNNKQIYIMQRNRLCGIGVPGELCIAGEGLARGYLNREDLTSEKFVKNIFGEGRMYRSGDLARWLPDGNIEYIGRIDEQVKIRGYRVELGEIEEQIRQFPDVKEAAVIARTDGDDKVICAYFTGDVSIDTESLLYHLRAILPHYMIPNHVMQIAAIPYTRNGKLDKNALPQITHESASEYIAPITKEEILLCEIVEEVLDVPKVGLNDRFFDLGGDSIKAIRIVSKIRANGYEVSIKDIMDDLSIGLTAKMFRSNASLANQEEDIRGKVVNTPIIQRFQSWNLQKPGAFVQDMIITIPSGQSVFLKDALTKLVLHHDMLRAVYRQNCLEIRDKDTDRLLDYSEISLSSRSEERDYKSIIEKAREGFNLETGPLIKAICIRKDALNCELYFCIHHLVVDSVSWRILLEDLKIALTQLCNGEKVSLPVKTDSYQKWAEALQNHVLSDGFKKEAVYWEGVKEEITQSAFIFAGKPANDVFFRECKDFLSEEMTNMLLYKTAKAYHTEINDILLCSLGMAVKELNGQDKFAIGLESHGRNGLSDNINIDRTVGWFTSVYPFIITCTDDMEKAIIENKENLRKVPNNGIGYGLMQEDMFGREPKMSFNYLGQMDKEQGQMDVKFCAFDQSLKTGSEEGVAINAVIQNGQLEINFSYATSLCTKEEAEKFVCLYKKALEKVVVYCASKTDAVKTPSDYLLPELSMEHIADIKRQYPDVTDIYPLSPLQKGMLYHNLADSASAAYNIQHVIKVQGAVLPSDALEALDLLAYKYEVFKTAIIYENLPMPVQIICGNRGIEFEAIDLSNLDCEEKEARFTQIKKEDLARGFSLKKDALARVKFVKFNHNESFSIWCYHHSIIDGWCMSLVYGDYIEFLEKIRDGKTVERIREELASSKVIPYRNYIKWLQNSNQDKGMDYWVSHLEGYEDVAEIKPMEIPEAANQQMAAMDLALSSKESEALFAFARENNISVNTITEAAWGIVLQKYCHSRDVVYGKIVSGRNAPISGIENMVGLFINTVPVRVKTREKQTVISLLEQMKEDGIRANQFDYCSLAEIQSHTSQKQDLIKTLFVFENYYTDETRLTAKDDSLILEMQPGHEQTNYQLTVIVHTADGQLKVSFQYMPNVYTEREMNSISAHYMQALRQLMEDKEREVTALNLTTDDETQLILGSFNETYRPYPKDKTIIDVFDEVVSNHRNKKAVVFKERWLTYEDLDKKSNLVARKLSALGIKPGKLVMVIARRSLEMVIGICGILKAGGAYLPVDASLPDERIRFMLFDSNTTNVLTYHRPFEAEGITVLDLEQIDSFSDTDEAPEKVNKPLDLAYCIYTSGTTGNPKGVMIAHQNLIKLVINQDYIVFDKNTKLLQTAQLAFDASAFEIWGPLLNGGTVYVIEERMLIDCEAFKAYMIEQKINTVFMTTALFNQMVNFDNSIFDTVPYLMFGGEKATELQVERILDRGKAVAFVNLYGPTEGTTLTTHYNIRKGYGAAKLPIGKPISNTQVYVMEDQKLCGIGIPGELCIAGDGVAQGYLNREELTKEKFVDNPFGAGKLYYSGDLVRFMPDGNIEFIGRIDEQVKVRGFRVELGEITNSLEAIPYIKQAVVIVKKDSIGEEAICAYLESSQEIDINQIKNTLRVNLPEYMIPSYIMQLEAIPITGNGKVNKQLLPQPEACHETLEVFGEKNEYEKAVLEIWQDILKTKSIGRNDNFFEIGGNSLLLITMQAQINQRYSNGIAIGDIFANPTVKMLAEFIEQKNEGRYVVKDIIFPAGFFADGKGVQSSKNAKSIAGDMFQAMYEMYRQDLEEFNSTLLLMYTYALFQISNQQKIPVLEGYKDSIKAFDVYFQEPLDLNQCKDELKKLYSSSKPRQRLHVQRQKNPNGILPVLLLEYDGEESCREWADFSVSFHFQKDRAVLQTQIYDSKLNANAIIYFMEVMLQMITSIFSK